MSAYNTRGVVRPASYYRSLNNQNTADVHDRVPEPVGIPSSAGDMYEVERLVSSRLRKVCIDSSHIVY